METDFTGRTSRIPPTAAIGAAMVNTKKVLFQPFNALKWLKFGIVAFLVGLAEGGSNFNFNLPGGDHKNPPEWASQIPQWIDWCKEHLALIIAIGIAVLIVITVIWTIFLYLSSRFSFVYMDGVINNDMRIKEYYKANRASGWSYFMWRMGFIGVVLPVVLVALVPLGFSIFFIAQKGWTAGLILLLIGSILFFLAILVLLAVISMLTTDFVLPIMSLLKLKSLKAWGVLWTLIKGDKKTFLLYILLKIALGFAAAFALIIPCCLMGLIFAMPMIVLIGLFVLVIKIPLLYILLVPLAIVIGVVSNLLFNIIISPIAVFFRSYSLVVLEGFGDEFASINRF